MSLYGRTKLLNQTIDISEDFTRMENEYFIADRLLEYDSEIGIGALEWDRYGLALDWAFTKLSLRLEKNEGKEFPQEDYLIDPVFNFSLSFTSPRTIRLRLATSKVMAQSDDSLMLEREPKTDSSWKIETSNSRIIYKNKFGMVILSLEPWSIKIFNAEGKLLTQTHSGKIRNGLHTKTLPFSFVRRSSDYSRSVAAVFTLSQEEKIYGCGESFTRLNKRGQKIPLYMTDVQSASSREMYKPVPFFMSSRGYGMFAHTTTPSTFDFGHSFDGTTTLYIGDDFLDLFIFLGSPSEILSEYTLLTGRSPLPPLWSFGLWMSRFTYKSQDEVLAVSRKLRQHKIPCDVIHIDAGWFEQGLRCDYKFNKKTFPDPALMTENLRKNGFRTSLWQLPYLSPENPLYDEVIEKKLYIQDGKGNVPTDDVILDFSNHFTRLWYRDKIHKLFDLGISVIKADFGECAPFNAIYASGNSGFYEHNIYPLRYTGYLTEVSREKSDDAIIWARSAWAGGQRYPVHWSGDPESTDSSMASTLRAGLSLGLCGFSFWSHDIGGFSTPPDEDLYRRWMFFGLLTSHSRCHGFPPKEPWEFSDQFMEDFRQITELKYRMMPYVYTQAAICSEQGQPLLRPLFFQYPEDPTCWLIEDQYLFGKDLLVAPFFEPVTNERQLYLPPGNWIGYEDGKVYEGKKWHIIRANIFPGIILVRDGSIIPHIQLAQSTAFMEWNKINLFIYAEHQTTANGSLCRPDDKKIEYLSVSKKDGRLYLEDYPDGSKIEFNLIDFRENKP